SALHCLANFNIYLGTNREKYIHPGAKAYKTEFIVLLYSISFFDIELNTTGQYACYLPHEQFCLVVPDNNGRPLIECGRLWMPGYEVLAGVILHVLDYPTHRVAVNMYIKRRHEYGNLQAFILKVFRLKYLFY